MYGGTLVLCMICVMTNKDCLSIYWNPLAPGDFSNHDWILYTVVVHRILVPESHFVFVGEKSSCGNLVNSICIAQFHSSPDGEQNALCHCSAECGLIPYYYAGILARQLAGSSTTRSVLPCVSIWCMYTPSHRIAERDCLIFHVCHRKAVTKLK